MIKKIVFILVMIFCYSCMDVFYHGDLATPIKINGIDSLKLNSECGEFSLVALGYQMKNPSQYTIFLKYNFNTSNGVLHTDSFKILKNDGFIVNNVRFMHRSKKQTSRRTKQIEQNVYQIEADEIVFVSFDISFLKETKKEITILPSDYIICKEKPLLKDTIKISLK